MTTSIHTYIPGQSGVVAGEKGLIDTGKEEEEGDRRLTDANPPHQQFETATPHPQGGIEADARGEHAG